MVVVEHVKLDVRPAPCPLLDGFWIDRCVETALKDLYGL